MYHISYLYYHPGSMYYALVVAASMCNRWYHRCIYEPKEILVIMELIDTEKKLYSVFCIQCVGAGEGFFLKKVKLLGGVSSFETCSVYLRTQV